MPSYELGLVASYLDGSKSSEISHLVAGNGMVGGAAASQQKPVNGLHLLNGQSSNSIHFMNWPTRRFVERSAKHSWCL